MNAESSEMVAGKKKEKGCPKWTELLFCSFAFFFSRFWALWHKGSVKNVLGVVFGARCTENRHYWWTECQNEEKSKK